MVHGLPIGSVIESLIGALGAGALAQFRWATATQEGRPTFSLPTRNARLQRERPSALNVVRLVTEETLRRVAEIVKGNSYNPRVQIHDEIGASPRTASRRIDEARKRGVLTEED
jgi:predicted ATPase